VGDREEAGLDEALGVVLAPSSLVKVASPSWADDAKEAELWVESDVETEPVTCLECNYVICTCPDGVGVAL
jgi:hypothetical protein